MNFLPLAFGSPLILAGLIALPVIWWLLRMTPPRPQKKHSRRCEFLLRFSSAKRCHLKAHGG